MPASPDPESLLPLSAAEFQILLALADRDRHGYSIMQEIAAQTQGKLRIGPTTLYRSLKRLLDQGLIVEADERPDPALDDERRRYYRLADFGRRVAAAEVQRLSQALAVAQCKALLRPALFPATEEEVC